LFFFYLWLCQLPLPLSLSSANNLVSKTHPFHPRRPPSKPFHYTHFQRPHGAMGPNFKIMLDELAKLNHSFDEQDERLKDLVLFWIIDETQSTNLYAKCVI
jgi:hypothetical protein